MTNAENLGMSMLEDFIETAKQMGICYCGNDIPKAVQIAVIEIVEQYIEEYKNQ